MVASEPLRSPKLLFGLLNLSLFFPFAAVFFTRQENARAFNVAPQQALAGLALPWR
jgi:hypothetical protein